MTTPVLQFHARQAVFNHARFFNKIYISVPIAVKTLKNNSRHIWQNFYSSAIFYYLFT